MRLRLKRVFTVAALFTNSQIHGNLRSGGDDPLHHDRVKAQPPSQKYSQNFVINTVQILLKCRLGVGSSRTFRGYFRCIYTEFRLYFRRVILLHRGPSRTAANWPVAEGRGHSEGSNFSELQGTDCHIAAMHKNLQTQHNTTSESVIHPASPCSPCIYPPPP